MALLSQACESLPFHTKGDRMPNRLRQGREAGVHILLPSLWGATRKGSKPLRRTAWLDGLRGFAALMVYFLHHNLWAHGWSSGEQYENTFGWHGQYYFISLPLVRTLFSGGHFAVVLFFAISGYVLSMTPLALVQTGDFHKLCENISSALFRRWLRLFLPVLATTFIWMTSWHLLGIQSAEGMSGGREQTYLAELWKWYDAVKNFSFLFNEAPFLTYNYHLWSIILEFRGSIVVYTSILAFSMCRTNIRLALEAGLAIYFLYIVDAWWLSIFMVGVLLSDLDLLQERNQMPKILDRLQNLSVWVHVVMIIVGLYLGGVPNAAVTMEAIRESPGWYWLSFAIPGVTSRIGFYFRVIGAILAMISFPRVPLVKAFFESHFCQYLARISFSLYLVHGPILWSFGDLVYAAVGRSGFGIGIYVPTWQNYFALPGWGPYGLEVNYLLAQILVGSVTLWTAEVVTKAFDEPSLKFSKWLLECTIDEEKIQSRKTARRSSVVING